MKISPAMEKIVRDAICNCSICKTTIVEILEVALAVRKQTLEEAMDVVKQSPNEISALNELRHMAGE